MFSLILIKNHFWIVRIRSSLGENRLLGRESSSVWCESMGVWAEAWGRQKNECMVIWEQ